MMRVGQCSTALDQHGALRCRDPSIHLVSRVLLRATVPPESTAYGGAAAAAAVLPPRALDSICQRRSSVNVSMASSERRPAPTRRPFASRDRLRPSQGAQDSRRAFPLPTLPGQRTGIGALSAPTQPTCAAGRWIYKGRVYFEPGCETPASAQ